MRLPPAVWLRLAGLMLIVASVAVLATLTEVSDLERLRTYLRTAGPVAPLAFVVIYATYTLAPLPRTALSIFTGVIFGFWWGVPLAYAGSLLGAAMAFGLGRALGKEAVTQLSGKYGARANDVLSRRGFLAVLGARVIPVVPFMAVNYTAGVSEIRPRSYWLATVIGVVPGTFFYVAVGAYAMEVDDLSTEATVVTLGLVLATGIAYLLWRRRVRG